MKRTKSLQLVLLGSGVLLAGACDDRREACEQARQTGAANAEQVCRNASSGGGSGSGGSWWGGSRRGGFGAHAVSSGG
jgi:hypothetical protein